MADEQKLKHAGHGYHETIIQHHDDGSHTIKHVPHPDHAHEMFESEHAGADLDGLHDSLEDHLRNSDEIEALLKKEILGLQRIAEAIEKQ
jgi:hypothetical protein